MPERWMSKEDVRAAAPEVFPPCFPDRIEWVNYLYDCHRFGERVAHKPFHNSGEYRVAFSFCGDCTTSHATQKRLEGKCDPETFRKVIPIKGVACN